MFFNSGPGPFEPQNKDSEERRPLRLSFLRIAIYAAMMALIIGIALLVGWYSGPLSLIAFVVLALEIDAPNFTVTVKRECRTPFYLVLAVVGVLLSSLVIVDAWPFYISIGGGKLWVALPNRGSFAISVYFRWARFFAIALSGIVIWILRLLDRRLMGEVIAPNWYNSIRAKSANVTGAVADDLGISYATNTTPQNDDDETQGATPNAPVY